MEKGFKVVLVIFSVVGLMACSHSPSPQTKHYPKISKTNKAV
jgi:hypothetical protein